MNRSTKWLLGFAVLAIALIVLAAPPPGTYITSNFFTTNRADIIGTNGVTVSSNFIAGGNPAIGRYVIDGSGISGSGKTNIFNPNQFSQIGAGGTNVNIKSGVRITNEIVNGQTNIGSLVATNPLFDFGGASHVVMSNNVDSVDFFSSDPGGVSLRVMAAGTLRFPLQTANTLAKFDSGPDLISSIYDESIFTNNFTFNTSQFSRNGVGGTNISIKSGPLITNLTTYGTETVNGEIDAGSATLLASDGSFITSGLIKTSGGGSFGQLTNTSGSSGKFALYGTGGNLGSSAYGDTDIIKIITNNNSFNANQFSQTGVGGTNINIKSGALVTNLNQFGLGTNNGSMDQAGPQTNYGTTRLKGAVAIESQTTIANELDAGGIIATNGITNQTLTASTVMKADANKKESSIANGTGYLRDDGSGTFSYDIPTNSYTFDTTQFTLTGTGGTNVAIKNGALLTNTTTKSSSTTTVPSIISLAGGHNTNAIEIQQGPAVVGGFDSNGIATMTISNATVVYPACYRVFTQTAFSTCTNITTTETTWLGAGVGSLTLPAGFWQVGRSLTLDWEGAIWSQTSPGGVSVRVKLGTTQIATNVPISFAVNRTNDAMTIRIKMTCWTNSSTGWIQTQGFLFRSSGQEGTTANLNQFRHTKTALDTTAAMAIDLASTNGATTVSIRTEQFQATVLP